MAVALYDSAEIMPLFSIGRAGAAIIVMDPLGKQRVASRQARRR